MRAASSEQLNAFNDDNKTPLLLAIEHGHRDFAQHLVKYGANTTLGDNNGTTPILLAAYYCDIPKHKSINLFYQKDNLNSSEKSVSFSMKPHIQVSKCVTA